MLDAMNTARAEILDRIRKVNAGAGAQERGIAYQGIERGYQQAAEVSGTVLAELFADRLREYDAQVYETTGADVRDAIAKALAGHGQKSAVVAVALPEHWIPAGLSWRTEVDASTDAMSRAAGAIASCEVAIAHTGTIVVRGSRRLTLLPDRLLCVVREEQIVETVPEAFARLQPFAKDALTFISGPSATADIEMTRIRGVHGPRFLDVVLVRG
ncbi:MAG TPA: LUD domain-containing protein [Acidobacteriaceae bacterium]|nr:LUD domain-containing protein [Acidobacteriaceae bacterium]